MDISETLAPTSDQLDAVDLLGGPPRIFTVADVSRGNAEQPVNVHLAEFPRVWRPGKSMRRVLAHCWGKDASTWVGKRVELYCDTDVMFGGEKVGGTRISRLSHIDGPTSVPIIIKKGRSGGYKVTPLPDAPTPPPARDWDAVVATAQGLVGEDELRELWTREQVGQAPTEVQEAIKARVAEVKADTDPDADYLAAVAAQDEAGSDA